MTSTIYEIILFCLYFHKPIFIIGQDWYCLLNHCLSTQKRPHARPRAMPRAVFSFTNNTVDKEYNLADFKQLIRSGNNTIRMNWMDLLLWGKKCSPNTTAGYRSFVASSRS